MQTTALVLFDLDGVLADYDHAIRLRVLAERSGASEKAVSVALFESGLERDADLGLYDAQGLLDELARRLGAAVSLQDYIAARRAAMTLNPSTLMLARDLAPQTRIAILTNNNLLLRDYLHAICPPLFPHFQDQVFCSAQLKRGKPDPEVFRQCLQALDVPPHACLFIDDKAENAHGARAAGLSAHHYLDPLALRAELTQRGLLEQHNHAH